MFGLEFVLTNKQSFYGDRPRSCGYHQSIGARYVQAVKDFRSLMRQKIALQVHFEEMQNKDIGDPDEPPPAPYSEAEEEEYSYAQGILMLCH